MYRSKPTQAIIVLAVIAVILSVAPNFVADGNQGYVTSAAELKPSPQDRPITTLRDLNRAFTEIAGDVTPAVVTVSTEKTLRLRQNPLFPDPFLDFFYGPDRRREPEEREFRQQGLGSGVIVSPDGNILTNHHVIADADSIYVRTLEGRRYPADVIGSDSKTDIAVLKIDATDLPIVKIGNSDDLQVGELVLAVGSPMSENLAHTVTQGIVSAKGRSNIGLADYEDFIQTDAAINPGNSGGPLVNLDGELIGINSAIVSRTGGFQGIGFAVPSNMAIGIMNSLLSSGKVVRGWLGVLIQDIDEDLSAALKLSSQGGALVGDVVPDSPADRAGFEPGDVITQMNDRKITSSAQLRNNVAATAPGTEVTFEVYRDAGSRRLSAVLGELPSEVTAGGAETGLEDLLGFSVRSLTPDLARQYSINPNLSGAVVTSIDPASSAYRADLRQGDLIRSVNRRQVDSAERFYGLLEAAERGQTVLLRVHRNENTFFIAFTL
ncbi:MAG: DegQ family serine endoprotease [Candidatus Zixiibacteriota bacterium]|nr:MAG: DegQ family serine endoprotease [candidate division Zixibacteria bacterium]